MKDSLLQDIKNKYLSEKEKNELLLLKYDENVRKLFDTFQKLNYIDDINGFGILDDILDDILDESLVNNTDTNNIIAYLGTYYQNSTGVFQVSYNTRFASYRLYADIEKTTDAFEKIPVMFSNLFEKTHDVIYLDTSLPHVAYKRVRSEFVKNAIEHSQEEAKKLMLKKYRK